jgi:hypothetical protein
VSDDDIVATAAEHPAHGGGGQVLDLTTTEGDGQADDVATLAPTGNGVARP